MKYKTWFFEHCFRLLIWRYNQTIFKRRKYKYFVEIDAIEEEFKHDTQYFDCLKYRAGIWKTSETENNVLDLIPRYCGFNSIQMNRILNGRSNEVMNPEIFINYIDTLDNFLKLRITKNNYVTFRITDRYVDYKIGKIYLEKSFLSTSVNPKHRNSGNETLQPNENKDLLILMVPTGIQAVYVESQSKQKEYELLINRNQQVKVLKKCKIFGNRIILLELLG